MKILLIISLSIFVCIATLIGQPYFVTAPITAKPQEEKVIKTIPPESIAKTTNTKPIQISEKQSSSTPSPVSTPISNKTHSAPTTTVQQTPPANEKQNIVTPYIAPSGKSNELVRKAVVNILCSAKNQTLNSISGSGVIIDPRGIILTNAHLAQYFLLTNYQEENFIRCVIRTGSPAYPRYKAELVYISPSWIIKNATMITSHNPTGTGEYDYAFLRITEAIDKTPLPLFDFLVIEKNETPIDQPVVLAGYPASFLGSIAIERNLYLLSALSTVIDIFTLGKENTPDLISVGSSVLAQQGASGGAVASPNGTLLGIIVTTTEATSTAQRDLRAITTSHIERSFTKETGSSIENLLEGNIAETAINFEKNVSPLLREHLLSALTAQ